MKNTTRLPHKAAKATTRISPGQQMHGALNPTAAGASALKKSKAKKLNQRGSTYAAPPAPRAVGGNLNAKRGTTRMGGY